MNLEIRRCRLVEYACLDGDTNMAVDRALFDTYSLILDSPQIVDATVETIHQGNWAPGALRRTIERHAALR